MFGSPCILFPAKLSTTGSWCMLSLAKLSNDEDSEELSGNMDELDAWLDVLLIFENFGFSAILEYVFL